MNVSKTASGQATRNSRLLINRNFALLWSGQAISQLGDAVFGGTLMFWIVTAIARGQSWAPLAVSGLFLSEALAMFGAGPLAGVFVDRWEKRRTMLWMDGLRAVLIILLLLPAGTFPLPFQLVAIGQLVMIYLVIFFATTCARFFDPSRLALVGDIVPEPDRTRAIGLLQSSNNLATVIGPPLAALLYFGPGVQWALIINALSFVASFLALRALQMPPHIEGAAPEKREPFLRELMAGLRFLVGSGVLITLMVAPGITMFGVSAVMTLGIFFALDNLHIPASLFSVLSTASGVGAIAGALLTGLFAQRIGVARTFWLSILVYSGLLLVYTRLTSFIPAVGIMFLLGIPIAAIGATIGPLLLHVTPRELIGRIHSVMMTSIALSTMIGTAIVGYLTSTIFHDFHAKLLGFSFGPIDTVITLGSLFALLAGVYAMINLRGLHVEEEQGKDKN
jgi:MFS family permease